MISVTSTLLRLAEATPGLSFQPADPVPQGQARLEWEAEPNGKLGKLHIGAVTVPGREPVVIARVFDDAPVNGNTNVVLTINGYRFKHLTVEEAKADAVRRIQSNAGVYLSRHRPEDRLVIDAVHQLK